MMDPALRGKRDAFLENIGTRPLIMGVLNVTPDSFSDGGLFQDVPAAVTQAQSMAAAGCDIVDVGGESTRPGAVPVSAADELARIEPVLEELATSLNVPVSVDTYKAEVAARAARMGAVLVNDVWGLQKDPAMADTIAETECALVIMHNRVARDEAVDILADIRRFFDRSLALAEKAGIPRGRIILDPGIGFGKTSRQNLAAVAGLAALRSYGLPILVGVSRKGFLGSLTGGTEKGFAGTLAAALAAVANGAAIVRVHDVAEHAAALKVFSLIRGASRGGEYGVT
ncbi:MAG TPA: dihydropteroate synthase [Xanthobacteraceae bacterium]|jgi:dihydropteroate synthase|nr:dihydropteroate synthase [Xanthobacteraceae bacterium]